METEEINMKRKKEKINREERKKKERKKERWELRKRIWKESQEGNTKERRRKKNIGKKLKINK